MGQTRPDPEALLRRIQHDDERGRRGRLLCHVQEREQAVVRFTVDAKVIQPVTAGERVAGPGAG